MEGHPQAFVELFQLTHRPAPAKPVDPDALGPDADAEEDVPSESLGLLKSALVAVEAADRAGDHAAVYGNFQARRRGSVADRPAAQPSPPPPGALMRCCGPAPHLMFAFPHNFSPGAGRPF